MTITLAHAALKVARWMLANREQVPAEIRDAAALLAEAGVRRLQTGMLVSEIDQLRAA
ncbi:hypothetical protein [Prescottella equi]